MIKHSRETFKLSFVYTTTLFTESTKVSITRVKHFRKKWSSVRRRHSDRHSILYPQQTFTQSTKSQSQENLHRLLFLAKFRYFSTKKLGTVSKFLFFFPTVNSTNFALFFLGLNFANISISKKRKEKKALRFGGNRCCLFSLPRVLPPPPLPMQISAACHHRNVCLRQSCDRNQCAQHTQRQAKVTDKRTDGRTIHQRLRFPCHLPNLVAIHKRKEPNLNSPLLHVIMESRQFS